MKTWTLYIIIGLILVGAAVVIDLSMSEENSIPANEVSEILRQRTPRPLSDPMILPPNYRETFIHYATIDRIDGISRKLYISPSAIDALAKGDPIPEGSQIIIEAYSVQRDESGQFVRDEKGWFIQETLDPEIHSSEFRTSWQLADMHTTSRSGDWNFMAFDFETGEQMKAQSVGILCLAAPSSWSLCRRAKSSIATAPVQTVPFVVRFR
jgi:Cytochrome P460